MAADSELCSVPGQRTGRFFAGVICFNLLDTVTYLIVLIVMADIQNPSANVIRSLILLAFNYLEMAFGMAYLYYLQYRNDGMIYREALKIGLVAISGLKQTVLRSKTDAMRSERT